MKKNTTHTHILDTAIDLFWRKSYHGVNMNELAREASVNKATIYQHFASKEELAVAAVVRATERTEEYIYQDTFDQTEDPLARLQIIYEKSYEIHKEVYDAERKCRGCPFVNIGVELATTNDDVRVSVSDAFQTFKGYFRKIARDHGVPDGQTPDTVADTLMANMNGCLVASKLENRPDAINDGRDRAMRILTA